MIRKCSESAICFCIINNKQSDNKSITKLGGMGNKQETQGKAAWEEEETTQNIDQG